jgi:LPS export ABC transporter protein LptC
MILLCNKIKRLVGWGILALFGAGCGDAPATPVASDDLLAMDSDMVGYETKTILTTDGVKSGVIDADTAYFFDDSTFVYMRGVNMVIHTDQGDVRATVTADQGRYDQYSQQMHAQGNVVLIMPGEDRRVESEELYYNPVDQQIWSESSTTYWYDGEVTRGTCLRSDLEFRDFQVCNIRGSADVGG